MEDSNTTPAGLLNEVESLRAQVRRLEQIDNLAHDFSNVLTAILGSAELLHDTVQQKSRPDPIVLDLVADIQRAAHRAKALTQRLMSLSRGQAP